MSYTDKKIPDAEVVEEEKVPVKETVEVVEVIHAKTPQQAVVRIESRSRHQLKVECFEIDEDGYIDIVVSDADN